MSAKKKQNMEIETQFSDEENPEKIIQETWPACCNANSVADEVFAAAYEAVPAELRACFKRSIACHEAVYGINVLASCTEERQLSTHERIHKQMRPLDWTLVCLDADYSSGVRLLAAVLPAILAGVPRVGILRLSRGKEWPPALLAALELVGVERVAELSAEDVIAKGFDDFLTATARLGYGRMIVMGHNLESKLAVQYAREHGLSVLHEPPYRQIGLLKGHSGKVNQDLLAWAHPDAEFVTVSDVSRPDLLAVCANSVKDVRIDGIQSPLVLEAGQEGLFFWTELHRKLFKQTFYQISSQEKYCIVP